MVNHSKPPSWFIPGGSFFLIGSDERARVLANSDILPVYFMFTSFK
jgi:hypothetical protein